MANIDLGDTSKVVKALSQIQGSYEQNRERVNDSEKQKLYRNSQQNRNYGNGYTTGRENWKERNEKSQNEKREDYGRNCKENYSNLDQDRGRNGRRDTSNRIGKKKINMKIVEKTIVKARGNIEMIDETEKIFLETVERINVFITENKNTKPICQKKKKKKLTTKE